ncbi:MAG: DUF4249 domain-containing protein [Bacteroidales bacterium]|nr:DUF4249 domain-containing protein [Bacteroidales bacterium]
MILKKLYNCSILLLGVITTACITPFTPKGVESDEGSLVIEGDIILNGDTKIYLSLLRALDSPFSITYVTNAQVWVENQHGTTYSGSVKVEPNEPPYYIIDTRILSLDQQYKLCVHLQDGRRYESNFLTPLVTPEIDAIGFMVDDSKTSVDFHVTTHDSNSASRFYKWRYIEDWEIVAHYYTNVYYDRSLRTVRQYATPAPYYYCWRHSKSSTVVAKTDHLNQNLVYQQRLNTVDRRDDRISYLYSMELLQMSITKEAHSYWSVLKRNTDEIGSIFAPQPTDLHGNIRCITDPGVRVIGFISAGTITTKRIFVTSQEIGIYTPFLCNPMDTALFDGWRTPPTFADYYDYGFRIVGFDIASGGHEWFPRACVECTARGTKNKPPFWPNNHI